MSTPVVYNGISFTIPAVGDASWGTNVSNYLIALASGSLTKAGGAFTLTSEVDFGSNFGPKAAYFKSKSVNPSSSGVLRLANADLIAWRNASNTSDLSLSVNASGQLAFNGAAIPSIALGTANQLLGMNAAGTGNEYKTLQSGAFAGVGITNSAGAITLDTPQDIRPAATPTFAGATLTGFNGVVKAASGALSAALLVNADVSASAAIAYSKLNLAASIATSDLAAALLVPTSKGGTGVVGTATFPASGVVVTETAVETLTNKTFTTPVQTSYEDFTDIATPAVPGAGTTRIYSKAGQFYKLTSTLPESLLGGSGSGELNLIGSPSTVAGWTAGTGYALATTTAAGSLPLAGIISTAIQITSPTSTSSESSLAATNSYQFTTPASYAVRTKVELWLRPGSNFVPSEWTISVYDNSNVRRPLYTDVSNVSYVPNANGKYTTSFDALPSTTYTLRLTRVNNAGANAGVLNVTNVIVGPGIQPQGAVVGPVTPWTTTPSAGFGTATNVTASYIRIGQKMHGEVSLTSGTMAASLASFTLPPGLTLDTTYYNAAARYPVVGVTTESGNGATPRQIYTIADQQNTGSLYFARVVASAGGGQTPMNGTDFAASSADVITINFIIPIAQWAGSGSVNLAQNDVQYAYNSSTTTSNDTTSFAIGKGGAAIQAFAPSGASFVQKRVQFASPISGTPRLLIDGGIPNAYVAFADRLGGPNTNSGNTAAWGALVAPVSGSNNTQWDVYFYATYQQATTATWNALSGWRWVLEGATAGQAVGFGAVVPPSVGNGGSAGLVPAAGLPGRTDGNAPPTGAIGEVIQSTVTGTSNSTTASQIASLTLVTGGVYEMYLSWGPSTPNVTGQNHVFICTSASVGSAVAFGMSSYTADSLNSRASAQYYYAGAATTFYAYQQASGSAGLTSAGTFYAVRRA